MLKIFAITFTIVSDVINDPDFMKNLKNKIISPVDSMLEFIKSIEFRIDKILVDYNSAEFNNKSMAGKSAAIFVSLILFFAVSLGWCYCEYFMRSKL